MKFKIGPYTEGKKNSKKEADHFRLEGRNFNKQENSHMSLLFGESKTSNSPHLCAKILKRFIEIIMRFSYYGPDDLNNPFLCQGWIPEVASGMGTLGRKYIPRTRDKEETQMPGIRNFQLLGQQAVTHPR